MCCQLIAVNSKEMLAEIVVAISVCDEGNGGCSPHATCTADGDNVTCACEEGFEGDGKTCKLQGKSI